MFSKNKIPLSLLILMPLLLNACGILTLHGSGNVLTESRKVHGFDRVIVTGINELALAQGEAESLLVTADDNLMCYIYSEIRDGILYIRIKEGLSPSQPIQLKLSVKEIVALDISGIVNAETGDLVSEHLDIVISGLSTLKMGSLETQKLTVHLNGSTKFELTGSGETVEQTILLNGANTYLAPGLLSRNVDINASGPNDVTVWATDSLKIETYGTGKVDYYGNPRVTQNGSGSVSIKGLGNP